MSQSTQNPQGADQFPLEIVAAITVAAIAALGPNVRITRIRLAPSAGTTPWSEVGRSNLHSTHAFRKRLQ